MKKMYYETRTVEEDIAPTQPDGSGTGHAKVTYS